MITFWQPSRVMVSFFLTLGLIGAAIATFWLYVRAEQAITLAHEERHASLTLAEAAAQGAGVALLPVALFTRELQQGRLVQPFALELHRGAYWLTHLQSRTPTAAMQACGQWLLEQTH